MREIKFRGQRVDNKKWIYGFYQYTVYSKAYQRDFNLHQEDGHYIYPSHIDSSPKEIILETVGQYTGLKDKKETEIYDGDFLKDHNGKVYVILWDHGDARFVSVDLEDYKLDRESRFDEQNLIWVDCEIIGNIHSNPEFLK